MSLDSVMLADGFGMWMLWVFELGLGLGLVIFVHELGHFLVAKAVGIKVERFSLGFGPKLLGFTKGETEYWLSAFPLGGYVKMLGQEDFKPLEGGQADPRAFNNKPVWARLLVVSAGVVMNVIFAGILFIVVCLMGIQFPAAVIGGVVPGYPAESAEIVWDQPIPAAAAATGPATTGLPASSSAPAIAVASEPASASAPVTQSRGFKPGDEILSVNGKETARWQSVAVRSVLAKRDERFTFRIRRMIDGRPVEGTATVAVREDDVEKRLSFGMRNSFDLVLQPDPEIRGDTLFQKDDRLAQLDATPVSSYSDFEAIEGRLQKSPVKITVTRQEKPVEAQVPLQLFFGKLFLLPEKATEAESKDKKEPPPLDAYVLDKTPTQFRVKFRDGHEETLGGDRLSYVRDAKENLLTILGMAPRVRVAGVMKGSEADKKGFQPGDIIFNYGDLGRAPSYRELQDLNLRYAGAGANIVLLRNDKILPETWILPQKSGNAAVLGFRPIMDYDHLVVAGVEASSPAAKADIQPRDEIEFVNGDPVQTWQDLYFKLQALRDQDVVLKVRRGTRTFEAPIGKLDRFVFDPLAFEKKVLPPAVAPQLLQVTIRKANPVDALAWGVNETWDFTLDTYVSLHRLFGGTVPTSELRGPLGIGSAAIKMAQTGFAHIIYFFAIISISLAVINFLPIPVVDGGHVVFLAIEKVRGKPVSQKAMNIAQIVGLVLLLAVFVYATKNDIMRWINHQW